MRVSSFTALYSPLDIEYQQEYCGPFQDLSYKDNNGQIIAGLKKEQISGFGRPMVCVGGDKFQKQHIKLLWDLSQDIEYMDFIFDEELSPVSKFLLGKGYKATPYYTQVIDLLKPENALYHDLRKSYKQLVKQHYPWYILEGLGLFKKLHIQKIGRQTRSDKTWEIQGRMMKQGQAFIVMDEDTDCGCMFYYNGPWAYYAVSVAMPGKNMHHLIWAGIQRLQGQGVQFLEMGEQVFSGNEKLMNISKFKRGFGGETKTRLILRKD